MFDLVKKSKILKLVIELAEKAKQKEIRSEKYSGNQLYSMNSQNKDISFIKASRIEEIIGPFMTYNLSVGIRYPTCTVDFRGINEEKVTREVYEIFDKKFKE